MTIRGAKSMLRIRRVASFMGPDGANFISTNHGPLHYHESRIKKRVARTRRPQLAHFLKGPSGCPRDGAHFSSHGKDSSHSELNWLRSWL